MRVDQLNAPLVFEVLVRVIEGALVDRIERHSAVVAPAVSGACGLHADAGLDRASAPMRVDGVGAEAAGDIDAGFDRQARLAVAERDVVVFVHRDRSHPAISGSPDHRCSTEKPSEWWSSCRRF